MQPLTDSCTLSYSAEMLLPLDAIDLCTIEKGTLLVNRDFVHVSNTFSYRNNHGSFSVEWRLIFDALQQQSGQLLTKEAKEIYKKKYTHLRSKASKIQMRSSWSPRSIEALWKRCVVRSYKDVLIFSDLIAEVIDDALLEKILAGGKPENLRAVKAIQPKLDQMPRLLDHAIRLLKKYAPNVALEEPLPPTPSQEQTVTPNCEYAAGDLGDEPMTWNPPWTDIDSWLA